MDLCWILLDNAVCLVKRSSLTVIDMLRWDSVQNDIPCIKDTGNMWSLHPFPHFSHHQRLERYSPSDTWERVIFETTWADMQGSRYCGLARQGAGSLKCWLGCRAGMDRAGVA